MEDRIKILEDRCDSYERIIRGLVVTQGELIDTIKRLSNAVITNSQSITKIAKCFTNEDDV